MPSASIADAMVIGRVHATAAARAGNSRALDLLEVLVADGSGRVRADRASKTEHVALFAARLIVPP